MAGLRWLGWIWFMFRTFGDFLSIGSRESFEQHILFRLSPPRNAARPAGKACRPGPALIWKPPLRPGLCTAGPAWPLRNTARPRLQCCQPSRPSWARTERRPLFWGRTGTDGRDGRHRPTSIDDLRVIIHNRYAVIISSFLHYLDCEARSFNICSIRTWMLTTDWESSNIDKSIYILYHVLYSYSIWINSNRPMSAGDGGWRLMAVFLPSPAVIGRHAVLSGRGRDGRLTTLPVWWHEHL